MASCLPNQMTLPLSASSQHVATQAAAAAQAAVQAAALEQLRDKPRENKMMMVAEEQQRLVQHVLQQNLLAMATQLPLKIKLNNRGKVLKGGTSSLYCVEFVFSLSMPFFCFNLVTEKILQHRFEKSGFTKKKKILYNDVL